MKWIISYFYFSPVIFLLFFSFLSYLGGGPMSHRLAHFSLSVRKSIPHGLYPQLNVCLSHPLSSCQMYKMVKKNDRLIYLILFIFIEIFFFLLFWWYFFFPTFRIVCHQQSLIFTIFFSNILIYYHDDYYNYCYCYW